MGKQRESTKRLSSVIPTPSKSIDIKARKRIEELFEITDEIINAYNEVSEKYVHQIYRKYQQLQEANKKLKTKLTQHHCVGCKCSNRLEEEEESENSIDEADDDEQTKQLALTTTTNSVITRTKKNNPFIISDIEDTQNFDPNDNRFNRNNSDDEGSKTAMDTNQPTRKIAKKDNESEEESEDDDNDDDDDEVDHEDNNGMARLPLVLQQIIRKKAKKNNNAKAYLLKIPEYPAICEFLRDKSSSSFDRQPADIQVQPLISKYLGQQIAKDTRIRRRIQYELREIHRSYLRTFMTDPRAIGHKTTNHKTKLNVKKSPM